MASTSKTWDFDDENLSINGSDADSTQKKDSADVASSSVPGITGSVTLTMNDFISDKKTGRNWCVTIEPKNQPLEEMKMYGCDEWQMLTGTLEGADNDGENPHHHCLFHVNNKQTMRKAKVCKSVKEVIPNADITYASPVRVQDAYVRYMFKNNPDVLPQAFQVMKKEWNSNAPGHYLADKDVSLMDDYLESLKKEYLRRPALEDFLRRCAKDMGVEKTSTKVNVIKFFHSMWMDSEDDADVEPKRKKMKLAEELFAVPEEEINFEQMGHSLWTFLKSAEYVMPSDLPKYNQPVCAFYTLCSMFLMANMARVKGNFKQLWICGPSGVGKSVLTDWIVGDGKRAKNVAGDAFGVGRYTVQPDQEVLIFEEATVKQINREENLRTLNSLADGRNTTIKVHGSTTEIRPLWIIVNSNIKLSDMKMSDQTAFGNEEWAHSMQRRFIQVNCKERITNPDMFATDKGKEMNLPTMKHVIDSVYKIIKAKLPTDVIEYVEKVMKLY
jgi:hypothetical protein